MLGHVVAKYFASRSLTTCLSRRFDIRESDEYVDDIVQTRPDVVINCIGAIKQRTSDERTLYELNGVLPWLLRSRLPSRALFVQPSTDCVFLGDRGRYRSEEPPNATDAYGLSKALGESVRRFTNVLVVRTSIVGPELRSARGLLGWFLSQPDGSSVTGYQTHYWNGITTLEWCRVVERFIGDWSKECAIAGTLVQPCTVSVYSKYAVLSMINEVWNRKINVTTAAPSRVDRSLEPTHPSRDLRIQLEELRDWYVAK